MARSRATAVDGERVVVSQSPGKRVQIDIFGPLGGDLYVELVPRRARTIARAILRVADELDPPAERRR